MRIEEALAARLTEIINDPSIPVRGFSLQPDEVEGVSFTMSHGGAVTEYGDFALEVSEADVRVMIESKDAGWIWDTAHKIRVGLFTDQRSKSTWPLAGDVRREVSIATPLDGGAQAVDEKADTFIEMIKFRVTYNATDDGLIRS